MSAVIGELHPQFDCVNLACYQHRHAIAATASITRRASRVGRTNSGRSTDRGFSSRLDILLRHFDDDRNEWKAGSPSLQNAGLDSLGIEANEETFNQRAVRGLSQCGHSRH